MLKQVEEHKAGYEQFCSPVKVAGTAQVDKVTVQGPGEKVAATLLL